MPQPIQRGWQTNARRAVRKLAVLVSVWVYTLAAPSGWLLFTVLCFVWRRDPLRRARRLQAIHVRAYRLMHDWLSWCGIAEFDHRQPIEGMPEGPCVVVANHPTLMDITAITSTLGGGCTIVKPALFRRRLLYGMLAGAGHIEGPGRDPISAGRAVDDTVERLRQGFRAIIFPEGTRSPTGELGRFGRIAFEIACRAQVPLVSLTLTCDPPYLTKDVPPFRPPLHAAQLRLALLATDDPAACGNDSRALLRLVEDRYRSWLANLAPAPQPPYSPDKKEPEWQKNSSRTRSSGSSSTPSPSRT